MNFRCLWFLMARMAFGQQGPNAPDPNRLPDESRALKAYLGLTDDQLMQMRKAAELLHQSANEKVRAMQPQLEQKRLAIQQLLGGKNPDPTALGKAVLELRAVEKQIGEIHDGARQGALGVLTPEQRTKFKSIEDAALLPEATRDAIRMGLTPVGQTMGNPGGGNRGNQGPQQIRGTQMDGPRPPMQQTPGQPQPKREEYL